MSEFQWPSYRRRPPLKRDLPDDQGRNWESLNKLQAEGLPSDLLCEEGNPLPRRRVTEGTIFHTDRIELEHVGWITPTGRLVGLDGKGHGERVYRMVDVSPTADPSTADSVTEGTGN